MKKFATKNQIGPKLYRFKQRKGRSIQVVFHHLPGKEISTGTTDIVEAVGFATYRRGSADEKALALAMGHSGGNVRDDYDHRTASVLISQLEKHRSELVLKEKDEDLAVSPLKAKKKA